MRYPGDRAELSSAISPTPGAPAVLTGTAAGLAAARFVKNAPGRPGTDKLDAVCLAKLTERGMLRPSFVPPAEVRQLRDCAQCGWT